MAGYAWRLLGYLGDLVFGVVRRLSSWLSDFVQAETWARSQPPIQQLGAKTQVMPGGVANFGNQKTVTYETKGFDPDEIETELLRPDNTRSNIANDVGQEAGQPSECPDGLLRVQNGKAIENANGHACAFLWHEGAKRFLLYALDPESTIEVSEPGDGTWTKVPPGDPVFFSGDMGAMKVDGESMELVGLLGERR